MKTLNAYVAQGSDFLNAAGTMPARVVTNLFVLAMCVCAADGQTSSSKLSGIEGVVMVSPIRPGPARKGSELSNTAPLMNAKFRVTSEGQVAATFTTDTDGRFRILLKPGHYSFSLAENRFPRPCGPFEAIVSEGKMTEVEWRCDSGMH
jgi:hypothetical protein